MDNNEFNRRMEDIFTHSRQRAGRTYGNPSSYAAREPDPTAGITYDFVDASGGPTRLHYPDAIDCESFEEGEEEPWWLWRLPEKSPSTVLHELLMATIREDIQRRYYFGPVSVNGPQAAFKITGITGC